jgi:hypothetical protein
VPDGVLTSTRPGLTGQAHNFLSTMQMVAINDFGAGVGQYRAKLLPMHPHLNYQAYDDAGNIAQYTSGFVKRFDLTLPLALPSADWVLSLEVGEHVPSKYEGMLIRNLHRHNCRGIILSWGILGQGGHSHINNHSNKYIRDIMESLGYVSDIKLESTMRTAKGQYSWFRNSIMVFRREKAVC